MTVSRETARTKRADQPVVYFITAGKGHPVKIGTTTYRRLHARLGEIQTGSYRRLRVVHFEPGGKEREAELQDRWGYARLEGEWFKPVPSILGYLKHTPNGRSGRQPFPWGVIGRVLVMPFVGAWTIMFTILMAAVSRKVRRRRRTKMTLAVVVAGLGAGMMAYGWSPWPWPSIAVIALACCVITAQK